MGRRKPHGRGRPLLLSENVHKMLISSIRAGAPANKAAQACGIGIATFERWLTDGRKELARRDDGHPPDPDEEPFVQLVEDVEQARAQAGVATLAQIQKCAAGGFIIKETTREYRDPITRAPVKETVVEKAPPDWRAAAWLAERLMREDFGRQAQLAVTGAGGGPIQVATVDVAQLTSRITAALEAQTDHLAEIESGEVVAVEVSDLPVGDVAVDDVVVDEAET